MTNNDVIRRLRYVFDFSDTQLQEIFALANSTVSKEQISNWLKKEDDESLVPLKDIELASFLNGFIVLKRGKKEGTVPLPEAKLTNNIILVKLKIALSLQAEGVIKILNLANFGLGNHELSAFFRKPGHKHYRPCQDQILRYFLKGLQINFRPEN